MNRAQRRSLKKKRISQVDVAEREIIDATKVGLIAGAVRGMQLMTRLPEHFRARGWDPDPDLIACASVSLSLVRIGAAKQAVKIPPSALTVDTWRGLPPVTSAGFVVGKLKLEALLQVEIAE